MLNQASVRGLHMTHVVPPMALFLKQGAALTAARLHRSSSGRLSSQCPHCHAHDESECHRYRECPSWSAALGTGWENIAGPMCAMADVAASCAIPVLGMPKPAVCILHARRDACDTAGKSFVPFSMLERHFDDHPQSALEGIFLGFLGF